MAWGGARPGAGRKKKTDAIKRRFPAKPTESKALTVPAEVKTDLPAIDPRAWAMMLPQIEEISAKYSQHQRKPENNPFKLPVFPKAAIPPHNTMAMDSALTTNLADSANAWLAGEILSGLSGEGLMFPGYAYLAELAQRPEYRVMSETIADDATRRWIDFDVVGDEQKQKEEREKDPQGYDERMADPDERKKRVKESGKLDKVKALKDDQIRLAVKDRFYEQARNDGFFGRSHLLLDIWTNGSEPSDQELRMPIGDGRSEVSVTKVPRNSFKSLRTIEPVWTYPQGYNAVNPLRGDWYSPQIWYVMGKEIHGSRLQTFVGHPVPDMLKPAYAFGGLSLTQMAKPYVDIWLKTRQSVADLIHSFSVMVLMTDLSTLMQPGNVNALLARVAMFNMLRDNQGTFVVNKNTEDFKNVSASLAGLHELQSQAQEHMASVHRIPLVKFTGIQPAGLNASSEGEIKVYDDTISAYQSRFFDHNLTRVINFEQLSLFGKIDPEISYRFEPLREITQAEKGQKEKDDADRDQKYVDMGAIAPGEVRRIIIENKELPYTGLDPDDIPEPPAEEGLLGPGAGGAAKVDAEAAHGEGEDKPDDEGGGANDAADPFGATDAGWNESDHPRAPDGKFGSGGGGSEKTEFSTTTIPFESDVKRWTNQIDSRVAELEKSGEDHPDNHEYAALAHISTVVDQAKKLPLSQKQYWRFAYIQNGDKLAAAGSVEVRKGVATIHNVGSIEKGAGTEVMRQLIEGAKERGAKSVELVSTARDFYEKLGFKESPDGKRMIKSLAHDAAEWKETDHPRAENGQFGSGGGGAAAGKSGQMPDLPDFLKVKGKSGSPGKSGPISQTLKMPQFGLTPTPSASHQISSAGFKLPPRKPMPKSSGAPEKASSLVTFEPGKEHGVKELNGVAFKSWDPPADWAGVDGQAKISEPPLPELPEGMTLSSGAIIREPDGRVWIMRPSKGFGGYDQTFPKGGVEEGLSPQANAIKEVFEETGLKIKITGFAGDHEGDTTVSRYYMAERVGGDPADAGWEAEGVILAPPNKLDGLLNRKRDKGIAAALSPAETKPIDPKTLKKIGGKMGSNEGGTFEGADGQKYYIKRPQSKAHVENELAAARLYQLAGVNTLDYVPIEGGNHVATKLEKLDKKNIKDLTPAERKEATKDFAVHAWLGNYDAAGTGGDNQGVLNGKVTTLDVGGSLRYRAQGAPKGAGWGNKVKEIDSMRGKDPSIYAPDAAGLFGKMTDAELKESAARVTSIPDDAIRQAVGSDTALADTLIARKGDLASRFGLQAADAKWEESKHPRAPDGKFGAGQAVSAYVGHHEAKADDNLGAAGKLNRALRRGRQMTAKQAAVIKAMDRVFKETPPLKKPMTLYRGTTKDVYKGSEVRDDGYVSTSPSADLAAGIAEMQMSGDNDPVVYKITVPAGAQIVRMNDYLPEGHEFSDEQEHLLPRGSEFVRGNPITENGRTVIPLTYKLPKKMGTDEAQFEESKHPRAPDGKFTSGGGGGSSGGGGGEAAPVFKSKKEQAAHMLSKGVTKEALSKALGWPQISMTATAKQAGMKLEKYTEGGVTKYKGTPMTDAEKAEAKASKAAKPVEIKTPPKAEPQKVEIKAEPPKSKHGPATAAELEKAKKSVALQVQYVPNGASLTNDPAAKKLVEKFNDKWANKSGLTPAQLQEKVSDFKDLNAAMVPLMGEAAKKQAEAQAKAKAEAEVKAKQMAEAAAAKAKEAAQKNKAFIDELGISETQAEGFAALAQMMGKTDLVADFKKYADEAKGYGYPISGFECALIKNYSDGGYGQVNAALRSDKWSPAQHVYVAMVNKALKAMPRYTSPEPLIRNTNLTPEQIAYYAEGHVIQEKALMSTSTKKPNGVFSGNVRFVVKSAGQDTRAASIKKLSHYGSEDEVIFAGRTYFKVSKVEKLSEKLPTGATTVIHLEEWHDL